MVLSHPWMRGPRRAVMVVGALVAAMLAPAAAAHAEAGPLTRVIVELAGPPALAEMEQAGSAPSTQAWQQARGRAAELLDQQRDLVARAGLRGNVVHRLTGAYHGMVVEVPATQVPALLAQPEVAAVHTDQTFSVALDDSVPLVGAPQVWERADPDGAALTGAGTVVAILDTGVDYTHPDLGGGFGPGHKVVGGYDFVNDNPDPMDDHGHGTHVAGIVAADGAVTGVAPEASLTAYKVLDQFGSGQLSDILAALDHAVHPDNPHRADVVNMSLSGPGDGTDPMSVAASAAAAAGVVVVAAAGNSGPWSHTVGSPATGEGVLAVGASASGVWVPRAQVVAPLRQDLRAVRVAFSADPPAEELELELVDVGQGLPGSYDHIDVAGRAVLMEDNDWLGPQVPFEQALHAQERGAAAVFFHHPQFSFPFADGAAPGRAPTPEVAAQDAFPVGIDDGRLERLPAMALPGSSGTLLQELLADGEVRVEVSGSDATDLLPNFSSRGPTWSFTHKPELVAPGVEILSTLPDGQHARSSGTSMAAPHVAGAAALLRQLHPSWQASQVGSALANSAVPADERYGPLAQGAGRLDLVAAANATVVAEPAAVSLGLADLSGDEVRARATVTVTNLGDDPAELTFTVQPHGALEAEVVLDTAVASLAAGEQREVELRVELTRPAGDTDVTGWVQVDATGDGSTDITLPYLLSVRHLDLHVTPDPATMDTSTEVFVRSAAELAGAPTVTVDCPGLSTQQVDLQPVTTHLWRGTAEVAGAGLCTAESTGTGAAHLGEPHLEGRAQFEVVGAPAANPGQVRWQAIGPHNESGWFAFSDHRHRAGVVSATWPSLFVTEDRMQTWREVRSMPVADGIPIGVEVDPHDRDTMYVGINGFPIDPTYRGQLLLTTDHGDSWQPLPGRDSRLWAVALDSTGGALAVADDLGVRTSLDRGETWHDVPGGGSVWDLHWIGADLYVAGTDGLVRVPDAAGPGPGEPQVLLRPGVLGWAERVTGDEETLLVSSFIPTEVHASTDGGETFESVLQASGTTFQALELIGDTAYAVQSANLWVSPDRGASWEPWGTPVNDAVEIDVAAWPDPHPTVADQVYVSSSMAGVYAADGPGSFERTGIPAAEVYSLVFAEGDDGPALVAGTERDSFRTVLPRRASVRPDDFEWQSTGFEGFSGVRAQFMATSPADPSVVFKLQTDPGSTFGIYRSLDGGVSWERRLSPTEAATALLVHPADPDLVYAGFWALDEVGLVRSTDGGDTWRKIGHDHVFQAFAGHPSDPEVLWAGSQDGLFRSDDGGLTFEQLADEPVTAIALHPDDPQRLAVGGRALYTSTDGGVTLRPGDHLDLDMWITDIVFASDGSQRVFAATTQFWDELGVVRGGRGVLASLDGGGSWTSYSHSLDNPNVNALAISADGRYLYAGTLGGGVHRIEVAGPPQQPPGAPRPPGPVPPPVSPPQ